MNYYQIRPHCYLSSLSNKCLSCEDLIGAAAPEYLFLLNHLRLILPVLKIVVEGRAVVRVLASFDDLDWTGRSWVLKEDFVVKVLGDLLNGVVDVKGVVQDLLLIAGVGCFAGV